MQGMTGIMKQASSQIDAKNVQYAIEQFSVETEKQNFLQGRIASFLFDKEQIGDIMNDN
jgi:hypothetical protein